MIDILYVVVLLEQIEQLFHFLKQRLVVDLRLGHRDILRLGGIVRVPLLLQSSRDFGHVVRLGRDRDHAILIVKISRAHLEAVVHDLFLVDPVILVFDVDHTTPLK